MACLKVAAVPGRVLGCSLRFLRRRLGGGQTSRPFNISRFLPITDISILEMILGAEPNKRPLSDRLCVIQAISYYKTIENVQI